MYKLNKSLSVNNKCNLGFTLIYETDTLKKLSDISSNIYKFVNKLSIQDKDANKISDISECANKYKDIVLETMNKVRILVDEAETIMPKEYWPYPTYEDILFSV